MGVTRTTAARTWLVGLVAALTWAVGAQSAQAGSFHGVVTQGTLTATDFAKMQEANVGVLRVNVPWNRLQPTPGGQFEFAWLDPIVLGANAVGVQVLPTLVGPGPTAAFTPPTTGAGRAAYANAAGALAERYGRGGDVGTLPTTTYQIYNEQNSRTFWDAKPSPAKYAKLVKAAAKQIKQHDPNAEISLGGMFGTPQSRGAIVSWKFLKKMYKVRGIKKAFSTAAIHPYAPTLRGLKFQIKKIRKVLKQKRDKKTKLRITEIGFGSRSGGDPLNKGLQGQAKSLRKSLTFLENNKRRYKIRGFNWFAWQDNPSGRCKFCPTAGLIRTDGTRKPSFFAFQDVAE